jgi:Flp pilus assembly protein TadG
MRLLRKGRHMRLETHRSGQAIVEFALISPILLLIIFGLIDFARGWSAHHAIADAAREGVRMVVIDNGIADTEAANAIRTNLANAGLDPTAAIIDWDITAGRGQPSTVTVDYPFNFWILDVFMEWATGDETVHLISRITMRNEAG